MGCFKCCIFQSVTYMIPCNHIRIGFFFKVNWNLRNICCKANRKKNPAISISQHFMWTFLHLTDLCSEYITVSQSNLIGRSVHPCHVPCFTALKQPKQEGTFSKCLLGKNLVDQNGYIYTLMHELLSIHLFLVQGSCLGGPGQKQYQLLQTN